MSNLITMDSENEAVLPQWQMAQALFRQIAPDAAESIAPIMKRLFWAQENGDTFIYVNVLEQEQLAQAKPLVSYDGSAPLVWQGSRLFFAKHWHIERALAKRIEKLSAYAVNLPKIDWVGPRLTAWFTDVHSQDQQAAVAWTLLNNFMLITGGPGTGKTTTVAKLLALLCHDYLPRIALLAPTGKAAARLSQALRNALSKMQDLPDPTREYLNSLQGQTVHRLLGIKPPRMLPKFNQDNRLSLDIVLVDEASMLDNYLFLQLLNALPNRCRVIILGDAEQLPSVGSGAVLSALNQSENLRVKDIEALKKLLPERKDWSTLSAQHARLNHSHRFRSISGIGILAKRVLSGAVEAWDSFAQFSPDLKVEQGEISSLITALWQKHHNYWKAIEQGEVSAAFAEQERLIILTALREDSHRINQAYHQYLQQKGKMMPNSRWFAGQTILITRNFPAQQLYNGDVGVIMQPKGSETLLACFASEEGYRTLPLSRLPEHETAFAMTVHKSQGSEYEEVWYYAPRIIPASRALLYTAITRSKQRLIYWGDESSFNLAIHNVAPRHSALAHFLRT